MSTCNQPVGHANTGMSTGGYAQNSARSLVYDWGEPAVSDT